MLLKIIFKKVISYLGMLKMEFISAGQRKVIIFQVIGFIQILIISLQMVLT